MVAIENGGLSVSYDIDPAAPLEALTRERLAYVVQRLKLNERYLREINIYLTGQATAMRMFFEWGGADMLRTYLLTQMGVEIGQFHRNHWRPALLRALAAHEAFCGGGFQAVLP